MCDFEVNLDISGPVFSLSVVVLEDEKSDFIFKWQRLKPCLKFEVGFIGTFFSTLFNPLSFFLICATRRPDLVLRWKWLEIWNVVGYCETHHAILGYIGILIKLIRLPPADKSSKTLDLATFSNGFRVGQSGMMSAKLPLLDPDPRVSISRIAFSKIFVWAKLPLRDPAPKKMFSEKPSVSNILAFAKLPRRIVGRFSKMFGFCTFSTAGGIVKVGSERLTFLLAGSWIMFRNEMNISLDLHIAQQLHLSTMYNKYGINLKICTTLSIWTIC